MSTPERTFRMRLDAITHAKAKDVLLAREKALITPHVWVVQVRQFEAERSLIRWVDTLTWRASSDATPPEEFLRTKVFTIPTYEEIRDNLIAFHERLTETVARRRGYDKLIKQHNASFGSSTAELDETHFLLTTDYGAHSVEGSSRGFTKLYPDEDPPGLIAVARVAVQRLKDGLPL